MVAYILLHPKPFYTRQGYVLVFASDYDIVDWCIGKDFAVTKVVTIGTFYLTHMRYLVQQTRN
ncbi:hypothetical protein S14_85 [Shewanella sp. phage 1/4]|uniref:hypothetical protein n=1 Tax=Shewanella phage 1/4 TaxID=1458859 RepID=UPI0004F59479|nr:hypothetical protein S14_85 [Shewanella sp. phage 1/4]AHK11194.1 hypothetical protein S14_85 [Shewanella sp. phage 1/4]